MEGRIALAYLRRHKLLPKIAVAYDGDPSLITAWDIEMFVQDTSQDPTDRAMARLLGGTDRIARLNRLTFLDLTQDGRQDGGIEVARVGRLIQQLLPGPKSFIIVDRHGSANRGYAIAPNAKRNYYDLNFRLRSHMLAPPIPDKYRNLSPDDFTLGTYTGYAKAITPVRFDQEWIQEQAGRLRVIGRAGDQSWAEPGLPSVQPRGLGQATPNADDESVDVLAEGNTEFIYEINNRGELIEYKRAGNGRYMATNVSAITGVRVASDVVALDLPGRDSRAVYALGHDGGVIEARFVHNVWRSRDITADKLPRIYSSLVGLALGRAKNHARFLFGLNDKGELIEYVWRPGSWSARNVSRLTNAPALKGQIAAAGLSIQDINVYAFTGEGRLLLFARSKSGWGKSYLDGRAGVPRLDPGSVAAGIHAGRSPYLIGRDLSGNLVVVYRAPGALGQGPWTTRNVGRQLDGPVILGKLTTQYDRGTGATYVYARDRAGRLVQFTWESNNRWSYKRLESERSATHGADLAASKLYRGVYTETLDNAIAEYLQAKNGRNSWHTAKVRMGGNQIGRNGLIGIT